MGKRPTFTKPRRGLNLPASLANNGNTIVRGDYKPETRAAKRARKSDERKSKT